MDSLDDLLSLLSKEKASLEALYAKGYNPLFLFGNTGTSLKSCEAQALYSLIKSRGYKSLIEIGTGTGFSTLYFSLAISEGGDFLDSLDLSPGASANGRDLLSRFPVDLNLVNFLVGDSRELIPTLNKEYDFCLIDGSHEYQTSKEDFLNIYPKIRPGGAIAFHDIQDTVTTTTPNALWKEIQSGSLVDLSEISLVQFDNRVHELFMYPSDSQEISRLSSKWLTAFWISQDIDPMSMMGILFKK